MNDFDKEIAEIYKDMELEMIKSMKRNLGLHIAEEAKTGLEYPQWQAIKIREMRKYQRQNKSLLKNSRRGMDKDIKDHIRDEMKQGSLHEMKRFKKAKGAGYKSAVAMKDSFFKINTEKVDSLINSVHSDFARADQAILRMMNDTYRSTIFKFGMYVSNGVYTEKQAYDAAVKDFLSRGLNCIEYKDGRRVNIADYTSMAIRTVNQRAYMAGEGEVRKQLGETLVIISHHATSCPLCQPFENKVLIDDVYSGGKADDGDYMLLSQAMAEGLFHPRCRHGLGTYYPELEDIVHYDTEENRVNEYGTDKLNQAHIENMIQKYKRLTVGSVDPENIAKYQAKLDEWIALKEEINSSFEKMADIELNDWNKTQPRVINKETKKGLIEYAKEKNVNIVDLSEFDGDPELLKEMIDVLSKWEKDLPIRRKVTLKPSKMDSNDFGATKNRTIYIQRAALRDREITRKNININKNFFASSDLCDIVVHEYGHIFSKERGINAIEISKKAYYNIYKEFPTDEELLNFFKENISEYSFLFDKQELISEVLAKHNSNPTRFTKEMIKLLKARCDT